MQKIQAAATRKSQPVQTPQHLSLSVCVCVRMRRNMMWIGSQWILVLRRDSTEQESSLSLCSFPLSLPLGLALLWWKYISLWKLPSPKERVTVGQDAREKSWQREEATHLLSSLYLTSGCVLEGGLLLPLQLQWPFWILDFLPWGCLHLQLNGPFAGPENT